MPDTDRVTDPHREKHTSVRADEQLMRDARRELRTLKWTVNELFVAVLRWLVADPRAAVAALSAHRVEKRAGRPRGARTRKRTDAAEELARERFEDAP